MWYNRTVQYLKSGKKKFLRKIIWFPKTHSPGQERSWDPADIFQEGYQAATASKQFRIISLQFLKELRDFHWVATSQVWKKCSITFGMLGALKYSIFQQKPLFWHELALVLYWLVAFTMILLMIHSLYLIVSYTQSVFSDVVFSQYFIVKYHNSGFPWDGCRRCWERGLEERGVKEKLIH